MVRRAVEGGGPDHRRDHVVALIHARYRLTPATPPIEARYAHVWTVGDGRATHARATSGRTPEELGFHLDDG